MSSRLFPDWSTKKIVGHGPSSNSAISQRDSTGVKLAMCGSDRPVSGVLGHWDDATLVGDESGESAGGKESEG